MNRTANPTPCNDCDCSKRCHVLFKGENSNPDSWIDFQCDNCNQAFCKDHASEDLEGNVICNDCFAQCCMIT